MFDEKTKNMNLPLPHAGNFLDEDLPRLRESFGKVDEEAAGLAQKINDGLKALSGDLSEFKREIDKLKDDLSGEDIVPNDQKSFYLKKETPSGSVIDLPVAYFPTLNDLFLYYGGLICTPRDKAGEADDYQYEEIGSDPSVPSRQVRILFPASPAVMFDARVISSASGYKLGAGALEAMLGETTAEAEAARKSAKEAVDSAAKAAQSRTKAETLASGAAESARRAAEWGEAAKVHADNTDLLVKEAAKAAGAADLSAKKAAVSANEADDLAKTAQSANTAAQRAKTEAEAAQNLADTARDEAVAAREAAKTSAETAQASEETAGRQRLDAQEAAKAADVAMKGAEEARAGAEGLAGQAKEMAEGAAKSEAQARGEADKAGESAKISGEAAEAARLAANRAEDGAGAASDFASAAEQSAFDAAAQANLALQAAFENYEAPHEGGPFVREGGEWKPLAGNQPLDANEKILSQTENGLLSHFSVNYISATGLLQFTGRDNSPIASVTLPGFQLLNNADIVDDPAGQVPGKYLALAFSTREGESTVYVDVSKLVDVYLSGNTAIQVSNNKIALVIDANSGLAVGASGLGFKSGYQAMTTDQAQKLANLPANAQANTVTSVAGKTGAVMLEKSDISGLNNVDNTSDVNKPVSTPQRNALNAKVDKVSGKQLSTEDYSSGEKSKLAGIASGAQVNAVDSVNGKNGAVKLSAADVGALAVIPNPAILHKKLTAAVAALANFTVPAYVVGSGKLKVYMYSLYCRAGADSSYQYREVGSAGAASTTIQFYDALPVGTEITAIVEP